MTHGTNKKEYVMSWSVEDRVIAEQHLKARNEGAEPVLPAGTPTTRANQDYQYFQTVFNAIKKKYAKVEAAFCTTWDNWPLQTRQNLLGAVLLHIPKSRNDRYISL